MRTPKPHRILLAIGLCLIVITVTADSDGERAALAHLIHEMEALAPLIEEASAQAEPDARIRFQYVWLRQDLARVRLGIAEHINAPRAEPRKVPPLKGDYRR
ncbi:MAG: RAQPRD family integrative conjugative element protein [gamma proteobacterium endosymbiont of Lamellibrachia anaximandri]|nr:RAQPRD family integrative conjugative element protein [gamma proteobacterium endosymbiont of Lamellibrachia anaximandri]